MGCAGIERIGLAAISLRHDADRYPAAFARDGKRLLIGVVAGSVVDYDDFIVNVFELQKGSERCLNDETLVVGRYHDGHHGQG